MGVKKRPNQPKNFGKTSSTPRRPFEKERLDSELKLVGEYGLKNKRELRRIQLTVAKIRSAARKLLTLPKDDKRRQFEGTALVRRLQRLAILEPGNDKLEYCLSVQVEDFLKRRLQTVVRDRLKTHTVHKSRVLIYQRHISVGHQVVTSPSFLVRKKSEALISFREGSSLGSGSPGKVKRRNMKRAKKKKAAAAGKKEEGGDGDKDKDKDKAKDKDKDDAEKEEE